MALQGIGHRHGLNHIGSRNVGKETEDDHQDGADDEACLAEAKRQGKYSKCHNEVEDVDEGKLKQYRANRTPQCYNEARSQESGAIWQ